MTKPNDCFFASIRTHFHIRGHYLKCSTRRCQRSDTRAAHEKRAAGVAPSTAQTMGNCWACLKSKDSPDTTNRQQSNESSSSAASAVANRGTAGSVPTSYSGGTGLLLAGGDAIPDRSGRHMELFLMIYSPIFMCFVCFFLLIQNRNRRTSLAKSTAFYQSRCRIAFN